MEILTNWMFWIILFAIIFVMALIGYLSEGTDFAKKALAKIPKEEKPKKEEPKEKIEEPTLDVMPENAGLATMVDNTPADPSVEVLNVEGDNVWNDNVTPKDETAETVYNAPADDWSFIPMTNEEVNVEPVNENVDNSLTATSSQDTVNKEAEPVNDNLSVETPQDNNQSLDDDDVWKI